MTPEEKEIKRLEHERDMLRYAQEQKKLKEIREWHHQKFPLGATDAIENKKQCMELKNRFPELKTTTGLLVPKNAPKIRHMWCKLPFEYGHYIVDPSRPRFFSLFTWSGFTYEEDRGVTI